MLGDRMPFARSRRSWPWWPTLAPILALACTLTTPSGADESQAPNVVAARRHYDKARAFYEQGAYREAIGELDAAHTLDPTAKDLVFNLGVVHERLGDIDDALTWFRLYSGMKLTAQESDRAEAYVKRLEGVRKQRELDASRRTATPGTSPAAAPETAAAPVARSPEAAPEPSSPAAPVPAPSQEPRPTPANRVDAPVLATGGIAAAGLLVGTILGIKALADQPGNSFVAGRDGTHDDLASQVDGAHAEAVAADVAFGVAAVAGLACAYFYWFRPHATAMGATTVSAAPLQGGIALFVAGTL
jgi:hypothetical protein